jgi:heme-degrading monooxygenase HmoA
MLIRVFRARVKPGMGATQERMVRELSMPLMERQPGLIAFYAGRPMGSNQDEFTMVSLWQGLDALRAFAGDDFEQAVIPEPELANLVEVHVHHYEAFGTGGPAARGDEER